MKLRIETSAAFHLNQWVWRVRSLDTPEGETCLAVGVSRISEEHAKHIATLVAEALKPIFEELP